MKKYKFLVFFFTIAIQLFAQDKEPSQLHGFLYDQTSLEPLMYANVYVMNSGTGVITNEQGQYALYISSFGRNDSIYFQYMGYQSKGFTISDLMTSPTVYLEENIINISETLIFGRELDPQKIVQNVLENADSNYHSHYSSREVFVRERYDSDLLRLKLNYKKSTISDIDQKAIALLEQKIPRHSTSYTDFLGDMLWSPNNSDSLRTKINPNRVVTLKDKDITEMDHIVKAFEDVVEDTDSLEYWKVKTGIIEPQFCEALAEIFVIIGIDREETTKHHRHGWLETR